MPVLPTQPDASPLDAMMHKDATALLLADGAPGVVHAAYVRTGESGDGVVVRCVLYRANRGSNGVTGGNAPRFGGGMATQQSQHTRRAWMVQVPAAVPTLTPAQVAYADANGGVFDEGVTELKRGDTLTVPGWCVESSEPSVTLTVQSCDRPGAIWLAEVGR